MTRHDESLMPPDDEANRQLVENVHPPDWVNPDGAARYNLVVLGAGTAGLVTAAIAAGIGARVALIERHLMGGDCLNVGCVPSKALIRAARAWADVGRAAAFGVQVLEGLKNDFGAAMARMRQLRARLSKMDSAQRFAGLGVDVFIGEGRFTGVDTIEVTGRAGRRTLRFARAAVCTGARPAVPAIPGLEQAGCLTNETVFTLTELPARLAVICAGPIGCELAQSFARFGSRVTLLEQAGRILAREDADAAALVQAGLERDGVTVVLNARISQAEVRGREKLVRYAADAGKAEVAADHILAGAGRAPNVEGLGLEEAGVEYDRKQGVTVTDRLQTSNPRIYAAGDICSAFKFTHAADAMAQVLIQNGLFRHPLGLGHASTKSLIIPWCTYTQPELAHVGLYESEAADRGLAVETFTYKLDEVDRAVLDGEEEGFARLHVRKGTGQLLGATIVAAHAGEMIGEVTALMQAGKGVDTLTRTIHPYPTQAEAIKKAAVLWRKAHFTPRMKSLLSTYFTWTR